MAGEIVDGKRTFLEREGRTFELPEGHTAELFGDAPADRVILSATLQGGTYAVDTIEEIEDRVIVHVGDALAVHGAPGGAPAEPQGYPFPR